MLRRKKRMQYDPPGQRKSRQKSATWKRADQVFLTRRALMLKGAVTAGFAVLVSRLAYMQIFKGDYYAERTANSTTRWIVEKPTRGLIVDRGGRSLAENRRVWEVRAIPSDLPEKGTAAYDRVRNTLIIALHLPEILVIDPHAVPLGSEETIYRRVAFLLGLREEDDILSLLEVIDIRSEYNYLVKIDGFSENLAPVFRAAAQELPGVSVVNRFDYLVENTSVPDLPVVLKRDVPRQIAITLEANRLMLPGIDLDDSAFVRVYQAGESMSHILGYVGPVIEEERDDKSNQTPAGLPYYEYDDIIGKLGLELWMEKVLRGNRGGRYVEVDSLGIETNRLYRNQSVPGRNVKLTLDLELQAAATKALEEGIHFANIDRAEKDERAGNPPREYKAGAGAVVALNPKTGDVLALASYPLYDNQLFVDGISTLKYADYIGNKNRPLVNKAVADHFPPGSTIKLFVALAGLKENVVSEQSAFTCTGGIWVPYTWDESKGDRYLCWQRVGGGHGTLDLVGAIEQSCDVYFYNVGTPEQKPEGAERNLHYRDLFWDTGDKGELHYFGGLGIQRLHRHLRERFWFGEATGIELPFEAAGLVPDPDWKSDTFPGDGWAAGDTINTSIGQGFFLVTPLQLAVNTAAIANGGTLFRPRLIGEIVDDTGKTLQTFQPEVLRHLKINDSHLETVRTGMWRVVNSETGTANRAFDSELDAYVSKWLLSNPDGEEVIEIAGKTGTAEVGEKREDGTYTEAHGWFTCYAPFDDPEIVVTVLIQEGGEGSSYAAPVADKVLRAFFEQTERRARGLVLREDGTPVMVRENNLNSSNREKSSAAGDGTGGAEATPVPAEEPAA